MWPRRNRQHSSGSGEESARASGSRRDAHDDLSTNTSQQPTQHGQGQGGAGAWSAGSGGRSYWGQPLWSDDQDESVMWSAAEDEALRKSVKDYGLDDWTKLGDWSEAAAAVGGGKTPQQCFTRWQEETNRQLASEGFYDQQGSYQAGGAGGAHSPYVGSATHPQHQHTQQYPPQYASDYGYYQSQAGAASTRPVLPALNRGAAQGHQQHQQAAFRLPEGHRGPTGPPPGYTIAGGGGSGSYAYPPNTGGESRPWPREPDVNPHLGGSGSWSQAPPRGVPGYGYAYGGGQAGSGSGRAAGGDELRNLALLAGCSGAMPPAGAPRDDEDDEDRDLGRNSRRGRR